MQKRHRVYILLSPSSRFTRAIYKGVTDYLFEKPQNFELVIAFNPRAINRWHPLKGIIALVSTPAIARAILSYGVPVVNVSSYLSPAKLPTVVSDSEMGGRLAAEHLLDNRFHHFGYYGFSKGYGFAQYQKGYEKTVKAAGFPCDAHLYLTRSQDWEIPAAQQRNLRQWLRRLPKPVGILCGSDRDAYEVANACDALGFRVGTEVGIVGYGNDEFFCETSHPQLSSVESRPDRVGYEAMALLVRLIHGARPPAHPILIPIPGVVQRASSNVLSASDPHVASALAFIRNNIDSPLSIQQVFEHIPVSRSTLERRFRDSIGYSVLEAIHLLKVERLKHLLVSTSQTVDEISHACGFHNASNMTRLFRAKTGMAPGAYRARFQSSFSPGRKDPTIQSRSRRSDKSSRNSPG
ncbi:MAG: substrate-binding domain-containing protein [Chthoniobacterales bacterium]